MGYERITGKGKNTGCCKSCKHYLGFTTSKYGFDAYMCEVPREEKTPDFYKDGHYWCSNYEYNNVGEIHKEYRKGN